jgi:excisionase family DNA binding protein
MPKLNEYLTIKEAAEFLAVSPNTLRNWGASGKIAVHRNPMNGYRLFKITDLQMKRGKKNHLECSPVPVKLHMKIFGEIGDATAEALAIKIKPNDVTVEGNLVIAKLGSLNQAHTKASMRLEPDRRSYGGRAYDALFWISPDGETVSLGAIRDRVEDGKWRFPAML